MGGLNSKLTSISMFISKLEGDKKSELQDKDRLIHKIHQLELDLKNQQDIGSDLLRQMAESTSRMMQFEGLMEQIEKDKNEVFEKLKSLEEENEQLISEKHELKIEVTQLKTSNSDYLNQISKMRDELKAFESLDTYKDLELKEKNEASQEIDKLRDQLNKTKQNLTALREEGQVQNERYQKLEKASIQLKADLQKESEFVESLKRELKEVRAKYVEGIEGKKAELNASAIAASKLFTYYKMRESVARPEAVPVAAGMPISFYGESGPTNIASKMAMPVGLPAPSAGKLTFALELNQSEIEKKEITQSRGPSIRESTMISKLLAANCFSSGQSPRSVHERSES